MKLLPLIVEIVMIFVLRFSVSICGYDRQCPHSSQRGFRIHSECSGNSSVYNCLYNEKNKTYTELCDTNEKARAGLKYVLSGTIRNVRCSEERYQPITFWSNRSTDCLYSKSQCTEIGQLYFDKTSTIADSNCRCDYTRHFAFVSQPRNPCFCTPSIEDCSCHLKQCPTNTTLSPDYECVFLNSTNKIFNCKNVTHVHTNGSDVANFHKDDEQYKVRMRSALIGITVMILVGCIVIAGYGIRGRHMKICGARRTQISLNENTDDRKYKRTASEQNATVAVQPTSKEVPPKGNWTIPKCVSNINQSDIDSETKVLSDKKCNKRKSEIDGTLPLIVTYQNRYMPHVHSLIQKSNDINITDNDGITPLMASCQKGNISTVKLLIESDADINITDEKGRTSFFWSCVNGDIEILQLLIDNNCDEHKCRNDGSTPLMAACQNGHLSAIKLLIQRGADINTTDDKGRTSFFWSCVGGDIKILQLLIDNKCDEHKCRNDGSTPLMAACENGNLSTIKFLIQRGADINITDYNGITPLMAACQKGNISTVKLLIESDADINISDEKGRSSFFWSCVNGDIEILQLLIDNNCDEHKCKNDGSTPLMAACQSGNLSAIKLLIQRGADINITDDDGLTPLMTACQKGNTSIAKILIEKGANINTTDEKGRNAYHWSSVSDSFDILKLLIDIK